MSYEFKTYPINTKFLKKSLSVASKREVVIKPSANAVELPYYDYTNGFTVILGVSDMVLTGARDVESVTFVASKTLVVIRNPNRLETLDLNFVGKDDIFFHFDMANVFYKTVVRIKSYNTRRTESKLVYTQWYSKDEALKTNVSWFELFTEMVPRGNLTFPNGRYLKYSKGVATATNVKPANSTTVHCDVSPKFQFRKDRKTILVESVLVDNISSDLVLEGNVHKYAKLTPFYVAVVKNEHVDEFVAYVNRIDPRSKIKIHNNVPYSTLSQIEDAKIKSEQSLRTMKELYSKLK